MNQVLVDDFMAGRESSLREKCSNFLSNKKKRFRVFLEKLILPEEEDIEEEHEVRVMYQTANRSRSRRRLSIEDIAPTSSVVSVAAEADAASSLLCVGSISNDPVAAEADDALSQLTFEDIRSQLQSVEKVYNSLSATDKVHISQHFGFLIEKIMATAAASIVEGVVIGVEESSAASIVEGAVIGVEGSSAASIGEGAVVGVEGASSPVRRNRNKCNIPVGSFFSSAEISYPKRVRNQPIAKCPRIHEVESFEIDNYLVSLTSTLEPGHRTLILESNFFNVALRKTVQLGDYGENKGSEDIGAIVEEKFPLDDSEGYGGDNKDTLVRNYVPNFPGDKDAFQNDKDARGSFDKVVL